MSTFALGDEILLGKIHDFLICGTLLRDFKYIVEIYKRIK